MTDSASERHVKLMIALEQDEDGYPPASTESLWAIPVGEGLFKIGNIPFFATGIATGDVVSARPEHGALQYVDVVHPSGHSTLRVVVYDASEVPLVRAFFEQMGCSTELSHLPRLIAIDVPPSVPLETLKPVLEAGGNRTGGTTRRPAWDTHEPHWHAEYLEGRQPVGARGSRLRRTALRAVERSG